MSRRLPLVVLVGRPNVGKSTLFNRITRTRRAIVTAVAGTTRDTIAYPVTWNETRFSMVDTGGLFGASEDPLHALVVEQGNRALGQADLVLVVFDGEAGLVPGDLDVVQSVRALGKPMVAAVNKTDVRVAREAAVQFFELGLNPIVEISAEHGSGVDDLLDEVVRRLPRSRGARKAQARDAGVEGDVAEDIASSPELQEIGIAIVGRPNAGKSSLVNRLLREERMVVSEVPGTTRDAVDVVLRWHRRKFRIVDTAGIRRPGRVSRSGALES